MRILVIGDVMLDRDLEGNVDRIAPDAPVPILDVGGVTERAGGAGLAAALLCRDGLSVTLATVTGDDHAGRTVTSRSVPALDTITLASLARTRTITRIRSCGQSLLRVDDPGVDLDPGSGLDLGALERAVQVSDAILVADYGGGVASHPAIRLALEHRLPGTPLVWDPHPRGDDPIARTTVVTPNRAEAASMAARGTASPVTTVPGVGAAAAGQPSPQRLADVLRQRWRARSVAVTAGDLGVFTVSDDGAVFTPVPSRCPGDTLGAGDRFAGTLTVALGAGASVGEAVEHAVEDVASWLWAGGVAASHHPSPGRSVQGGQPAAPSHTPDPDQGLSAALRLSARVRASRGKVVATGGCFDVLHAGHVHSLRAARQLGGCLVVLLNSDDSVRRIKGPERPVNSVQDRRCLLEAVDCVDAVVVFDGDTPAAELRTLRPDVWAKGSDYAQAELPERNLLREWGGRVVLLPYLAGRSTSKIISQLRGIGHE